MTRKNGSPRPRNQRKVTAPRTGPTFTLRWLDRGQQKRVFQAASKAKWSVNTWVLEAVQKALTDAV